MGVPGFFRWLARKYPSIVVNAVEKEQTKENTPVDCTQPNPNFQEFDNLYIDMNGIIHSCAHPDGRPAPKNEEEMFALIFESIDRLFAIVRPRKCLYMTIDGVAPRAKMNQQRSRRFRASKEAAEKHEEILSLRRELESKGIPLPPPKVEHFDSNSITPGTPFMVRLAAAFRYFIHLRVNNDPAWQNLVVVFSDSSVPGEGEHKLIEFVRRQRESPTYNPNTSHCLCGPDADLIMLGLATHELNFNILRQEFVMNRPHACELCFQYGHELKDCQGLSLKTDPNGELAKAAAKKNTFTFIRLPILRECLKNELQMRDLPFAYEFERAIDDWILMCFFIGNDFLPNLLLFETLEGSISQMIKIYKNIVRQSGGWLTERGDVNLERLEMLMIELGKAEDKIFQFRESYEEHFNDYRKSQTQPENENSKPEILQRPTSVTVLKEIQLSCFDDLTTNQQRKSSSHSRNSFSLPSTTSNLKKRSLSCVEDVESKPKAPKVVIIEQGLFADVEVSNRKIEKGNDVSIESIPAWKERYYRKKFDVSEPDIQFCRKVAWAYTEGLCWVFKYYLQGCVSWDWYYPYHYAPIASDFDNIGQFKPDWSKQTKPFYPLEQLMSVFPAASKLHIPAGWRDLMTSPNSPIFKFYPTEFKIDLDRKTYASQGIAILPFVDQKLLMETLKSFYDSLTDEEKARNIVGSDFIFLGKRHPFFKTVFNVYSHEKQDFGALDKQGKPFRKWVKIIPNSQYGIAGEVCYDSATQDVGTCYKTLLPSSRKFMDISVNNCIMMAYKNL